MKVRLTAFLLVGMVLLRGGICIAQEPKLRTTLVKGESYRSGVAFSPDGRVLACGVGTPGMPASTLKLWDVATGREVSSFPHQDNVITCVAFSPDSRLVATGVSVSALRKFNEAGT